MAKALRGMGEGENSRPKRRLKKKEEKDRPAMELLILCACTFPKRLNEYSSSGDQSDGLRIWILICVIYSSIDCLDC